MIWIFFWRFDYSNVDLHENVQQNHDEPATDREFEEAKQTFEKYLKAIRTLGKVENRSGCNKNIRINQETHIFKYDIRQLGAHYLPKYQQNSIFIFFLDPLWT